MKRREALQKTLLMTGTAASASTLFSLLQSCQQQPRINWKPLFLNEDQAVFISTIVDTWLPKTDTPGALDVKVDMFLDMVFSRLYDENGKSQVIQFIDQTNEESRQKFGKSFADLASKDRAEILSRKESEAGTFNPGVWGTAVGKQQPVGFYRSLKSTAMWGYFSSEEIGKNVLNYDPIPGGYNGCIPLSDVGNSWSL
ncbi:gluconate 2-dehydrogenase subunit 3 family protein [Fulvivirga sedimenti]|uniref:Gluconate 2-dehydrogenase subunit 3 family protein n=1 Tax=Fulvivirga sedimenti TaxID=2879465 RepID=A0A9X1HWZ3_9BACT|nr:gluconate 2-dehydrogenase subunit 3 family protein [Fulvivirga sedimenti]MCA6078910.1 gluconate 2-dehydrogenase subunit 3 family protein [Fulvivirga sedimenti]